MTHLFELEAVGGPWAKRLATRRAGFDDYPWADAARDASPDALERARVVWTQSAFSEYASAAAFANIASALLACSAPIDLTAAAGDFVVDEMVHAELSARVAMALGGAVALEVDLGKLVRPATAEDPLLRAAELVIRQSCVGEALTVPVLKASRETAGSELVERVVARILQDESAHAELGSWFLDWAADRFEDEDRALLGRAAGAAVRAFAPIFASDGCALGSGALGVMSCASFDPIFGEAVARRVVRPLAARGIEIPREDLAALPVTVPDLG